MSIIIPAGMNKLQWSPKAKEEKQSKVVKTASAEADAVEEKIETVEDDPLAAAAKAFLQAGSDEEKCSACGKTSSDCECEEKEEKDGKADGTDKEACGIVSEDKIEVEAPCCEEGTEDAIVLDVSDEGEVEVGDGVVGDGIVDTEVEEEAVEESAVATVEEAVNKAEEALEEVKDAVSEINEAHEEMGVSEVEVSVEEENEGGEEGAVEVEETEDVEVPGVMEEENGDEEVEKEGMYATMASSEEFCKFAKLSDKNRAKLADYWVNMLGFPKDYVALMTKDYEK